MSEQQRCNGATECGATLCPLFHPHDETVLAYPPHNCGAERNCATAWLLVRCVPVPVEQPTPEPPATQLTICADAATCANCASECYKQHVLVPSCFKHSPSTPVDLDAIEKRARELALVEGCTYRWYDSTNSIDEIKQLRNERDVLQAALGETHTDLDLCQAEIERLQQQSDKHLLRRLDTLRECDAEVERLRRELVSTIEDKDFVQGCFNRSVDEREELHELNKEFLAKLSALRQAATIMERQRDNAQENGRAWYEHWSTVNEGLHLALIETEQARAERDVMRDELRSIASVVGPEVWRTLGDSVVIDAVRALVDERDKLRQRLEMYRTVIEVTG